MDFEPTISKLLARTGVIIRCHCTGLSLGSADGLDVTYLARLRLLADSPITYYCSHQRYHLLNSTANRRHP